MSLQTLLLSGLLINAVYITDCSVLSHNQGGKDVDVAIMKWHQS